MGLVVSFFKKTYRGLRHPKRKNQFLILVSFLAVFVLARSVATLQNAGYIPAQTRDPHIHHLVPGIFLLIIAGYIAVSFENLGRARSYLAILFGAAAALTLDEFALWFFLDDVYWAHQGRASIDAIVVLAVLFALLFLISEIHAHSEKSK